MKDRFGTCAAERNPGCCGCGRLVGYSSHELEEQPTTGKSRILQVQAVYREWHSSRWLIINHITMVVYPAASPVKLINSVRPDPVQLGKGPARHHGCYLCPAPHRPRPRSGNPRFDLYPAEALTVLRQLRTHYNNPPYSAPEFILDLTAKGLPKLAARARQNLTFL